jgi:hypothetical protein
MARRCGRHGRPDVGLLAADAARDPDGAVAARRATVPLLETRAPRRDLVFDRLAALVAAGTGAAAPDGSRHRFANISES